MNSTFSIFLPTIIYPNLFRQFILKYYFKMFDCHSDIVEAAWPIYLKTYLILNGIEK